MSSIEQRIRRPGPKRILALDGGGVRGLVTLGYLEKIEQLLAERSQDKDDFRLHHYFDLIGGTSTGAIIATLLCMGWRPSEISALYREMLPGIFKRRRGSWRTLLSQFGFDTKFDAEQFSRAITQSFDKVAGDAGMHPEHLTFETSQLKTVLAIVAKRIDSGAVWVQTNSPLRKYWTPNNQQFWSTGGNFDPNRDYNLKTMVLASASAPYFVDPVQLRISPTETGLFVDGGVSPHNNPSKELLLMATLRNFADGAAEMDPAPFGLGWSAGANNIFLVSVGTGYFRNRITLEEYRNLPEVRQAIHALRTIISDAEQDAVTWMQALSEPRMPWRINGKVEAMRGMRIVQEPLLSFQRYNVELAKDPLTQLMGKDWAATNLGPEMLKHLQEFDIAANTNLTRLTEIGRASAEATVQGDHFPEGFDIANGDSHHFSG